MIIEYKGIAVSAFGECCDIAFTRKKILSKSELLFEIANQCGYLVEIVGYMIIEKLTEYFDRYEDGEHLHYFKTTARHRFWLLDGQYKHDLEECFGKSDIWNEWLGGPL